MAGFLERYQALQALQTNNDRLMEEASAHAARFEGSLFGQLAELVGQAPRDVSARPDGSSTFSARQPSSVSFRHSHMTSPYNNQLICTPGTRHSSPTTWKLGVSAARRDSYFGRQLY